MKVLLNTHGGKVGGIARVVKNMLRDRDTIFDGYSFVTVNTEKRIRDDGQRIKIKNTVGYSRISTFFKRVNFVEEMLDYDEYVLKEQCLPIINFFTEVISRERPDLIVINGTYIIPWCFLQASKSFDIPTIVYYHGSISKEIVTRDTRKNRLIRDFEKSFYDPTYTYIFPSLLLKQHVVGLFGGKDVLKHTYIVPNSVPAYFFKLGSKIKKYISNSTNTIQIGCVMRWCAVKNKQFVKQFATYIATRQDVDIQLVLITDKDASDIYADIGENAHVSVHKQLSHKKLRTFFRNIDILLCPSKFETYGNVAQECIAVGTPVLVHKNMGVKETFFAVGLEEYVVDFEGLSMPELFDIIQQRILRGVSPLAILQLYSMVETSCINRRRRAIFDETLQRLDATYMHTLQFAAPST